MYAKPRPHCSCPRGCDAQALVPGCVLQRRRNVIYPLPGSALYGNVTNGVIITVGTPYCFINLRMQPIAACAFRQLQTRISVLIYRLPKPAIFTADWNHHFAYVPFVANRWAVLADRSDILHTKLSDPKPDGFIADGDPALGRQI